MARLDMAVAVVKWVAVYIRWSTDEQEKGTTLEVQLEACRNFIKAQGWDFRDELVFVDDGYSGGNLDRPAITRLRKAVHDGAIDCVVVFKIDRLSRSVIDTVNLVLDEWEGRCYVKSAREPIDTTSSMGKQFFYMLVSYAEWERSVIRERTLAGKRKRSEQGRNSGFRYAYGLRQGEGSSWVIDGVDADGNLIGDAAVVQRIFREYLSGVGANTIAANLRRDKVLSPNRKAWRTPSVMMVLKNPIYAGTLVYGKWQQTREKWATGKPRYRRSDSPTIKENGAPAIITQEEFDRAQTMRTGRATFHPRTKYSSFLLTGIARCGNCGGPISGHGQETRRYYKCTKGKELHVCDCGLMSATTLEATVIDAFLAEYGAAKVQAVIATAESNINEQRRQLDSAVSAARANLAKLAGNLERAESDYFAGQLSADAYSRLLQRIEAQRLEYQSAIERNEAARLGLDTDTQDGLATIRSLSDKTEVWDTLSLRERREALADATGRLTVYRKKGRNCDNAVDIEWHPFHHR